MPRTRPQRFAVAVIMFACGMVLLLFAAAQGGRAEAALAQEPIASQQPTAADEGCVSCHTATDSKTMHADETVQLTCVQCHGGDATAFARTGLDATSAEYQAVKKRAHVQPRSRSSAPTSANTPRMYAEWMEESAEFIRFVNPGDLRVAHKTCGTSGCHTAEVQRVRTSMMTHGAMLWGAALYNNGAWPTKNPHFGESYGEDGKPQRLQTWPPPSAEETRTKGVLPFLEPLPRWEISQPGNVLRAFERGGRKRVEVGNPEREEEPGKPDFKLSDRGFGTLLRTDPVFLGLQKTRLFDPLLSLPGTNDHPGDYRGSGCTGCHVVYANDRSQAHSGPYAEFGHEGKTISKDPTIPRGEPGHPLKHVFTKSIPSSQCMVCHMHPGTNMVATYYGYTFWDNEVDAQAMYPEKERNPSEAEKREVALRNPEGAAARGLWSDIEFLKKVGSDDFNKQLQHTQFADFHSHGWIFRAVFKRDRKGNLLDADGKVIDLSDPEKFRKAIQLKDIHLERGMHCVDCHFEQDAHGNGKLYGETRNAVEITCQDCHGTIKQYATLKTSGPAAPNGSNNLAQLRTPWKQQRFFWEGEKLFQRSAIDKDKLWQVIQVKDTITPGSANYSEKAHYAKTVRKDGSWNQSVSELMDIAHSDEKMNCFTCHSSWTPTCFGCHLSMTANQKMPMLRNEGTMTRNWTSYNFQVLRDDMYMLGVDGTVTGNKISPVRSACAIVVSSQNQTRNWIYYGQQTISTEGFSGQAFSPFVPHTVRSKETKGCTDCHVSANGDNNAWMAQLLVQGTNFMNYMGRFAYVAAGKKGLEAIAFAERDEPAAVIGSDFHKVVYPDRFKEHEKAHWELKEAYEHPGNILDVQLRGEYVYAAMGEEGVRIYDVANIDNKDFSERIVTAPVSPLGQKFYVKTKYAQAIASPSTLAIDPTRKRLPENEEQAIHPMYGFLYVADKYEGLVILGDASPGSKTPGVSTLLDGEPRNNFLQRALAFNPDGVLNGARRIAFAGVYAYVLAHAGLVVVSLDNPAQPKVVARITDGLRSPTGIAIQFRYAFLTDADGMKVVDITHLDRPKLTDASLAVTDARNIYVAREYGYISAGKQGIVIVDVSKPEQPKLDQVFTAGGALSDTNDVKIGMVSASQFAFVADGKNGFMVVQTFSPDSQPNFYGFSPRPMPKLVAKFHTHGPALAVSEGVDRDRAVDESGNQLAVFGRRGSRPLNAQEMQRLFLRNGELYTVSDAPPRR